MKQMIKIFALALALFGAGQARAGIPVLDASNLINTGLQVQAWAEQARQMVQQYQELQNQYNQAVRTFNSMSGVRGMESLVNNPALRRYLPNEWNQAMNLLTAPGSYTQLRTNVNSIKSGAEFMDIGDTSLDPGSDAGRSFVASQNQVALNRALSEEGYKQASDRIAAIQTLIGRLGSTPDAKDVADLQARIQGEQAMVQNELVKLSALAQLQQAQRDIQQQRSREIIMRATKSPTGIPRF
ncbi:P-type DNA transfer protein VirB5 [Pseudoduganella chitinolytica]|uniref:P-type DNA transfer protein VirB5 n=1 Tax=Pseudoduganella chitinolytica TaxID=34070 RepID=A0ABY8B6X7_9BURK|nr:P-type DNA transfer protein VirB5 [Pseudoduganella chitinolytica]WEF31466.1 P-type DNA transfer protein VirB5 [Pseudoduganella chitinolytica]